MAGNHAIEKVRVEGIWVGEIQVEIETWTVPMLQAEVARQLNLTPQSVRLISPDVILSDNLRTLKEMGIRNNTRILSNHRISQWNNEQHMFYDEMWRKFAKISEALERTEDGQQQIDEQDEVQSEKKFDLGSPDDQKATLIGLTIHWEANVLIYRQKYNGALQLIDLAERTFSLCNKENLEMVDNMVLLNINKMWCHFMLRDIQAITAQGDRLRNARQGLEVALLRDFSRITRFLPGVPLLETTLTMKLELLEGVLAYHTHRLEDAKSALESANEKHSQVDVPEEFLQSQQLDCSLSALKKVKSVSIGKLKDLVSIGFDIFLAVEALNKNNDDEIKAFTDLINPHTNALLQEELRGIKRRRTFGNAPGPQLGGTNYVVEWGSYQESDSSGESNNYSDNDSDSDDEVELVNLVEDLANATAPQDYGIEYYYVEVGINEYLELVA